MSKKSIQDTKSSILSELRQLRSLHSYWNVGDLTEREKYELGLPDDYVLEKPNTLIGGFEIETQAECEGRMAELDSYLRELEASND